MILPLLCTLIVIVVPLFLISMMPMRYMSEFILSAISLLSAGGILGDLFVHTVPTLLIKTNQSIINPDKLALYTIQQFLINNAMLLLLAGIVLSYLIEGVFKELSMHHKLCCKDTSVHSSSKHSPCYKQSGDKKFQNNSVTNCNGIDPTSINGVKRVGSNVTLDKLCSLSSLLGVNVMLISDMIHNFIDGSMIGCTFLVSTQAGIHTALLILMHEIPHQFGDVATLIRHRISPRKALVIQLFTGTTSLLGCMLVLLLGSRISYINLILQPLGAGMFLYFTNATLLSEINRMNFTPKQRVWHSVCLLIGIASAYSIDYIEKLLHI